jgi:SAM-dependent methyltransferase
VQQRAFGSLVTKGVYDTAFQHGSAAQTFFRDCMRYALSSVSSADDVAILECGCGPGAWLAIVGELKTSGNASAIRCYGFDLTSEMVQVARERLSPRIPAEHLRQGDILNYESYVFGGSDQRYQIIYAYDVIQQLPRGLQFSACQVMLRHLAPGGLALIFDHDSESLFGREMELKKFVTRYLGISLVPDYYCNARYPALGRFTAQIKKLGGFASEIRVAPDGRKRALIVRASPVADVA